jgi:uncharacterized membrane protein
MNLAILIPLAAVVVCSGVLYGCYVAFDRLQTRAEQSRGGRRWAAIGLAAGVGVIALCTFWACFAFSAGLFQALGLNL